MLGSAFPDRYPLLTSTNYTVYAGGWQERGVKAQENIKVMLDKGDLYAIFT
jgi:hypothetical protein